MALPEIDPTILSGNYIAIGIEGVINPKVDSSSLGQSGLGIAVLAKGKVETFSKYISTPDSDPLSTLSAADVDELAYQWLLPRGGLLGEGKLIPVGFNVGSQGVPLFLDDFPKTKSLLAFQVIDLNSICLTLEGLLDKTGKVKKFNGWKKEALKETKKVLITLGFKSNRNDLGLQAAQGLLSWVWFRGVINNEFEINSKKEKELSSKVGS